MILLLYYLLLKQHVFYVLFVLLIQLKVKIVKNNPNKSITLTTDHGTKSYMSIKHNIKQSTLEDKYLGSELMVGGQIETIISIRFEGFKSWPWSN